jgi:hypothetical protein
LDFGIDGVKLKAEELADEAAKFEPKDLPKRKPNL